MNTISILYIIRWETYNEKDWIRQYPVLQFADRRKSGWPEVGNNRQTFSSGDGYFFFMKKMISVTTIEKAANRTALSWINKLIVSYIVNGITALKKVTTAHPVMQLPFYYNINENECSLSFINMLLIRKFNTFERILSSFLEKRQCILDDSWIGLGLEENGLDFGQIGLG